MNEREKIIIVRKKIHSKFQEIDQLLKEVIEKVNFTKISHWKLKCFKKRKKKKSENKNNEVLKNNLSELTTKLR